MPHALIELFPSSLRHVLEKMPSPVWETLEEIRIRENRPLEVSYSSLFSFVRRDGTFTRYYREAYVPNREDCQALLERITNHSIYAVEEELRRGYVTVAGGHRIGLAGRTVLNGGGVAHLRDIAGFNVRVARARIGFGAQVLPSLLDYHGKTIHHTLVISSPQQGKTTLIRDLARCISLGDWHHPAAEGWGGRKVGVIDERSEIAACERGVPTFDLGPRCDVLDACPKAEGIMMMVRSLSPEVIVVDEIGRPEDAWALNEAIHAGVRVLATAHAANLSDIFARPVLAGLAKEGVFGAYVLLTRAEGQVKHRIIRAEDAAEEILRQPQEFGTSYKTGTTGALVKESPAIRATPATVTVNTRATPTIRAPNLLTSSRQGSEYA